MTAERHTETGCYSRNKTHEEMASDENRETKFPFKATHTDTMQKMFLRLWKLTRVTRRNTPQTDMLENTAASTYGQRCCDLPFDWHTACDY